MVFVNKRLGNGFRIKAIDSSLNQEHYFSGYKKHREFSFVVLSGTGGNGFGSDDYVSSSFDGRTVTIFNGNGFGYTLVGELFDKNNVHLDNSTDYLSKIALNDVTDATQKLSARLSFEFSSSTDAPEDPSFTQFRPFYRDSELWTADSARSLLFVATRGKTKSDGYRTYKLNFVFNENITAAPAQPAARTPTRFPLSNSGITVNVSTSDNFGNPIATGSFRDFKIDFFEPLSNDGVEDSKIVDNQHTEKTSIFTNQKIMPKVEDSSLREVSYHGWDNLDRRGDLQYKALDRVENLIYVVGATADASVGVVRKSIDGGVTWNTVLSFVYDSDNPDNFAMHVKIDENNTNIVFVATLELDAAKVPILRTEDGGATWEEVFNASSDAGMRQAVITFSGSNSVFIAAEEDFSSGIIWNIYRSLTGGLVGTFESSLDTVNGGMVSGDEDGCGVYVKQNGSNAGFVFGWGSQFWQLRRSTNGGTTWGDVDTLTTSSVGKNMAEDSDGNLYIVGNDNVDGLIRKSTDASSGGSWTTVLSDTGAKYTSIAVDNNNAIFAVGEHGGDAIIKRSDDAGSTWIDVDVLSSNAHKYVVANNGLINVCGSGQAGYFRMGQELTANSHSLGEIMLSPSIGFVKAEEMTSSLDNPKSTLEAFRLMNVSEFPHSNGIFQMKNMILGTVDSGKVGSSNDSIIQVSHLGSVVNIMWPKQRDASPVKGFGDFSAGQRIGRLTTTFEPGASVDATKFDHMALYCFLRKETSGTLDGVEVIVERRPSKSTGFATEQTIEFETSGSVTVGALQDLLYKKTINYGNLSIKEIGYPIDIPLTNVKEVRVSARQTIGQSDPNKNFIIWGRFINSEEET